MKKTELAKKNFQPGDMVAYIEKDGAWASTAIRYAQILSSEFYGIAASWSSFHYSSIELFGKTVDGVSDSVSTKDALAVATVTFDDDGNRAVSDSGSLIRAREFEFIVSIDEVGELEKIVTDRRTKQKAHIRADQERQRKLNEESAAAREELNAVLEGTGLYAPFGREAVRVLAIAKAYHEAKSQS